jgi:hypothetical protein
MAFARNAFLSWVFASPKSPLFKEDFRNLVPEPFLPPDRHRVRSLKQLAPRKF